MFCLIFCLILLSCFGNFHSLELKSISNATIPTTNSFETIDGFTYRKASKNSSGNISLPFMLFNVTTFSEKIELIIDNVTKAVDVFESNNFPSRSVKIYIRKELDMNGILYKIMFSKLDNAKTGEYKLCIRSDLCAISFIFSSPVISKFTKPKLGLEGDPIRITCSFESYPEVKEIIWSTVQVQNSTNSSITVISSNEHIQLNPGKDSKVANATLFIAKLLKNDSGIYMCTVISDKDRDSSVVKINVKDRWAALYPFIGIVIEVVILVMAILVYEKYQIRSQNRKNKNYGDTGDDDNKEPDIPLAAGGGDDDNVTPAENGCPAVEIEGEKMNNLDLRQREATTKNV